MNFFQCSEIKNTLLLTTVNYDYKDDMIALRCSATPMITSDNYDFNDDMITLCCSAHPAAVAPVPAGRLHRGLGLRRALRRLRRALRGLRRPRRELWRPRPRIRSALTQQKCEWSHLVH